MINSRQKGKRAELLFAKWLRGWLDPTGVPIQARRGQQFKGTKDSPDVIHTLKGVHFEVADRQGINIGTDALKRKCGQADDDCEADDLPIVIWRKRKRWWATTWAMLADNHRDNLCMWTTAPAEDVMRALGCKEIKP